MPTLFKFRNLASTLGGAGQLLLSTRNGRPLTDAVTTTVAGGTDIQVTQTAGGQALTWFTEPITEAVTISGTVTVRITGRESATTVNAGAGILIQRCDNSGAVLSTIVANLTVPATITEWTTAYTTKIGTYTPTSTAMAVGERIKATVKIRNVGTMGAGTSTIGYNDPQIGTNRSEIEFTENIRTDEVIEVQQPEIYGSNGYRV